LQRKTLHTSWCTAELLYLEHLFKPLNSVADGVELLPESPVLRVVGMAGKFASQQIEFVQGELDLGVSDGGLPQPLLQFVVEKG
jgi:hypothetical protein